MSAASDKEFNALATRVSQEASAIECSPMEYREGLEYIIDMLKLDIRASEETSP